MPEQLSDPARHAASYRMPLLNQIAAVADALPVTRQRVVRGATNFLLSAHERASSKNLTGLSGYVVCGSTGESVFLTSEEKVQLWEWVATYAAPEKLLIAGTGVESARETVARELAAVHPLVEWMQVVIALALGAQRRGELVRRPRRLLV